MRTAKFIVATLALIACGFLSKAQDNQQPWYILEYVKAKPGMDYLACEKVWKTIHKERVRLGKITSWGLYAVQFPSGTATEYDYVIITEVKDWNGIESSGTGWDDLMKIVTPEMQPIIDKTEEYRDIVRREVWQTGDVVYKDGVTGYAKYQVCNYMDVPDDGWADYWDMETKFVKPVHQLSINAGKRLGWGLYTLSLPWGADQPYQAATVDFYDKWSDMNNDTDDEWAKAHPGIDGAYVNRRINGSRTLVRAEIRVLVDSVQ